MRPHSEAECYVCHHMDGCLGGITCIAVDFGLAIVAHVISCSAVAVVEVLLVE